MEVCAIVASLNVNRFCSFSTSTSSTASGPAEHLASSARLVLPLLLARRPCRERGWGQTEDLALAWCLCGVSEVQVQQEQQQQLQRLPANPKAKLFLATRLVTAKTACFYYSCLPPTAAVPLQLLLEDLVWVWRTKANRCLRLQHCGGGGGCGFGRNFKAQPGIPNWQTVRSAPNAPQTCLNHSRMFDVACN